MAAPGVFDLELQEEDAIECDQSDDDAIEVEEVRENKRKREVEEEREIWERGDKRLGERRWKGRK